MKHRILVSIALASMCIAQESKMNRSLTVIQSPNKQKRNSNKSKLKQTKSKPSNKYKNSKPLKSKQSKVFRNKSNI